MIIPVFTSGMMLAHLAKQMIGPDKKAAIFTERHMKLHPDTGAIVFECTNFGPFTKLVHGIAKVPVFTINWLVEMMAKAVDPDHYY